MWVVNKFGGFLCVFGGVYDVFRGNAGYCADLVPSLFDTWWSNSKCTTSLVLKMLVSLLLSLSGFSSHGTT